MAPMSPELPSQPESSADQRRRLEDEAIDAIVYDVHPALAPRPQPQPRYAYPYGTPTPATNPVEIRLPHVYKSPAFFNFDFEEAPAQYVVPKRFGISAILGIMTALAILFGAMHWLDAMPVWYLFFGAQSIVICIVQMFHGRSPRKASAIAGAIMGPLFMLGTAWLTQWYGNKAAEVLCITLMMVPCGAFLGYLNGTCAAGIFLVMDKLEQYLQVPAAEPTPPSPALPAS
jgi:hypothetical protein